MKDFFSFQRGMEDNIASDILPYLIWFLAVFFVIRYHKQLHENKYEKTIRFSLVSFTALIEIIFNIWQYIRVDYDFYDFLFSETMIPLHVCAMSLWFAVYTGFTLNKKAFIIGFYLAMVGTPVTLFAGSVDFSFDRFRYWHFYLVHIASFVSYIYMFWVNEMEIKKGDIKLALCYLFIVAYGIALPLNIIFGSNFMYLYHAYDSPIENFPKFITIIIMTIVAITFYICVDFLFPYINNKRRV